MITATANTAMQQARFKKLIQKVNVKYLGRDVADVQKDSMLMGKLRYKGQDHEKVTERLFKINNDIELFGEDIKQFPMHEMARKIVPKNSKPQARLKYIEKGGRSCAKKRKSTICANSFQRYSTLSTRLAKGRRTETRIVMQTMREILGEIRT